MRVKIQMLFKTKSRQVKVVGATCTVTRYVHIILEADDLYQLHAHYKVADLYHMDVHCLHVPSFTSLSSGKAPST